LSAATTLGVGPGERDLIKAGFVTKFPEFIAWPEGGPGGPARHLELCALGHSRLVPYLRDVSAYTDLGGRALEFRALEDVQQASDCEILYIAPSEAPRLEAILQRVNGGAVLTVADTPGFAQRGVMINLVDNDRIGFEINRRAVAESRLHVSFRLLELAEIVE
jgi:hypothetical protein